jgi:non-heme chloroperoxidase
MVKNAKNPDGLRKQLAASRTQFYRELPIPFYGFNRPDAKVIEGVVDN